MRYLRLSELAGIIRTAVEEHTGEYWVTAEIAHMNVNRKSGHCYLELVEKEDERTTAQLRAAIWARRFRALGAFFRERTGSELGPGMKVLVLGRVSFHEVYGLSLNITELDPSYTLGEMALKRRETLKRLADEGLIDRNRELSTPLVPQRIAVVSSSTAAGYGDFIHRITENTYGYGFQVTLYEAFLQGERAEASLVSAFRRIKREASGFDVVAVIRGGGAKADLQTFDSYRLAREAALLPVPLLTGIGHERDETVLDRVAHGRLITPTAVAAFIVDRVRDFDERVEDLAGALSGRVREILERETGTLRMRGTLLRSSVRHHVAARQHALAVLARDFDHGAVRVLSRLEARLEARQTTIRFGMERLLARTGEQLRQQETAVRLLDPRGVLRRGYSITRRDGRAVRDASVLKRGDIIQTVLQRGTLTSTVDEVSDGG